MQALGRLRLVLVLMLAMAAVPALAADEVKPKAPTPADQCAALLTEAIPLNWIEKMITEGRATEPQLQRLRDIVQRLGFSNAALNRAVQGAPACNGWEFWCVQRDDKLVPIDLIRQRLRAELH